MSFWFYLYDVKCQSIGIYYEFVCINKCSDHANTNLPSRTKYSHCVSTTIAQFAHCQFLEAILLSNAFIIWNMKRNKLRNAIFILCPRVKLMIGLFQIRENTHNLIFRVHLMNIQHHIKSSLFEKLRLAQDYLIKDRSQDSRKHLGIDIKQIWIV